VTAALALALAGALSAAEAPPPAPARPNLPIEVLESGELDYDVARERGVVTGGVVLRRGLVIVRADTATYDTRTGEIDAQGHVLLTEPGRVLAATAMHLVLDGPYHARNVVAFLKDTPLDLSRCTTLDQGRNTGRNQVELGGAELDGTSGVDAFEIDRARITLCDCGAGGGGPPWEIHARRASVVPGDHAWLFWPVLYIRPRFLLWHRYLLGGNKEPSAVPVFAFPVMYLPLGDRQTGFLMPQLELGGVNGTVVTQPFFLTLGRSYDATIAAGYTAGGLNVNTRGVKGFGGDLEMRWAPSPGARGHARFSLLHSAVDAWPGGAYRPPGLNRFAFSLAHDDRLSDRTWLRADLGVVGDPYYTTDFNNDVLLRALAYRRNVVLVTHREDDLLLEADAAYHLSLISLDNCPGSESCSSRAPYGFFGAKVPTFHRLPSASATLLPVRVAGPLRLSATVSATRFAPIHGPTGDEGVSGVGYGDLTWGGIANASAGFDDGRWTPPSATGPGERLAATRALGRVELHAPLPIGRALEIDPWATGTTTAYAFETALPAQVDARATAGLTLSSRLSRTWGAGPTLLRHDIEPQVAWAVGTRQVGPGLPNYAYDELDVAAPLQPPAAGSTVVPVRRTLSAIPGAFDQLRLSLRNRLTKPSLPLTLDLTLGQDVDVAAGSLSETWVRGQLQFGRFGAGATARFLAFGTRLAAGSGPATTTTTVPASIFNGFTVLEANANVALPYGFNVHGGLLTVGTGGSPAFLAGLEPYFDPRPVAVDPVGIGSVGIGGKISGAVVAYDALFYARPQPNCSGQMAGPRVYDHRASLVWDSPCHCWKAGVTFERSECLPAHVGLTIDLSSFGAHRPGS
jgi:LPS-assembly protein